MQHYATDLAYIHDVGFGDHVRNMSRELLQLFGEGTPDKRIIDLGCGSGISTQAFSEAGFQTTGVDLSAAMIALAKKRDKQSRYVCASFLDFKIPPCYAVTSLGEVINYLFDAKNTKASLKRFFRAAYAALSPGGFFVIDFAEPGRHTGPGQAFRQGDDWACLVEYHYDKQREQLSRDIVSFRKVGKSFRRAEETHTQQMYRGSEIAKMLREIGFKAKVMRKIGEYELPPYVAAIIARRP